LTRSSLLTARGRALGVVLVALGQVEGFVDDHQLGSPGVQGALGAARQVCGQDVQLADEGPPTLRRGVAKDRRILIEDAQMRHGRKRRSHLVDGYKRHVLRELDSGLVCAVGSPPPTCPRPKAPSRSATT
jgi:transposase